MTRAGEDVQKKEPSCTACGNADWCSHCGKQYGVSSKKSKMELPFDPSNTTSVNTKKSETPIRKNICIPMFIAALFIIAKIWKQPKCPLADE